jgi:hypothetical protein
MRGLPIVARLYICAVVAVGAVVVVAAVAHHDHYVLWYALVLGLMSQAMLSRTAVVGHTKMNLSSAIVLASYMIVGPWGAALVGACSVAVVDSTPMVKRSFNGAMFAICALLAGLVYVHFGGPYAQPGHPHPLSSHSFPNVLVPVALADLAHCLLNGLLLTGVICLSERVPPRQVLLGTLYKSVASYLGYGIFGLLMAVLWVGVGINALAAVLVLLPLVVARWAFSQFAAEQQAYQSTIAALVQAVETKDRYTRGHSERVARASVMIARVIGMREDRINALRYAGILHDVGKLGVPTKLLQKSSGLTAEEFAAIKLHPVRGLEMLNDIEFLDEAFKGILHHHERLDGNGYPMGLRGATIPEFARVIAVADAFDSMTSTRSYRNARTVDEAVEELQSCKGSQFDPRMVDALMAALERDPWVRGEEPAGDAVPAATEAELVDHDDPTFTALVRDESA